MSICTDKTIVIYALGRYSPLFILSVQSKFCLLFDNCVHVFVFCVWCVEDQSCGWHFDGCWDRNLFLFFKITHWWHCSLFFGGFQVLALSLLCYAALRWALLNCDSEDISLISKRWQHELNILILEIVSKTSDGMWCVCECGISFFSRIGDTITVFPVYFWGIAQVLCKISIIQVWWGHFGILLLHQIQISSLLTHRQHLRCSLALLLAYLTIKRMPNRTFSHLNAWAQLRNNIGKHSP